MDRNGLIHKVAGLSIDELIEIESKLKALDMTLKDLKTFLNRDKVQLFAELNNKNKILQNKLDLIVSTATAKHGFGAK